MEVRKATSEDREGLARGMKEVADEGRWLATQRSTTLDELRERFRRGLAEGRLLWVLEGDGRLIGCLGLHPEGPPGVLTLGMWILAAARGRGGGRLLVETALAELPPGTHTVDLEVFDDNAPAIAFYEATGFEREGVRRNHYRRDDGSLRSALIMARLFEG